MMFKFWPEKQTTMLERSERYLNLDQGFEVPRSFSSCFPVEAPTASPGTSRELIRSIRLALSDSPPSCLVTWHQHLSCDPLSSLYEWTLLPWRRWRESTKTSALPIFNTSLWGNFTSIRSCYVFPDFYFGCYSCCWRKRDSCQLSATYMRARSASTCYFM